MFSIEAYDFHWLETLDGCEDLCLHARVVANIGDECIEYKDCTVSATALYLLKSLTDDHIAGKSGIQMLPCCGHFMIPNDDLSEVAIIGCPNGVDWSVIHEGEYGEYGEYVRIVTESGKSVRIHINDYKNEVFAFADTVEVFYKASEDKTFSDEFDKNAFTAFWNEWSRRRNS